MVYRRGKRPSFYWEAKQRVGYKQLCTDTSDRRTAQRIEHAWGSLADQRAWDLLEPIVADLEKPKTQRTYTVGRLLDLWTETKGDVAAIRLKVADVNVEPFVKEWHAWHTGRVEVDTAKHALYHARAFFPEGESRLASAVTTEWLTTTLAAYPGKRNTRRKVHSSLSGFLAYLTDTKRLFPRNPMEFVERPPQQKLPPRFYRLETAERIVNRQDEPERRALFALLYGTPVEISVALQRTRQDVNPATHEIYAPGTKAHTRQRVCKIADWAWPTFWNHVKALTPQAPIFPGFDRWTCSDWHRQTVGKGRKDTHGEIEWKGLELAERLPMHNARHHWAVRMLESGAPVRVVQEQLGHESPQLTLDTYGAFIPNAQHRTDAEKQATAHETKRRKAK